MRLLHSTPILYINIANASLFVKEFSQDKEANFHLLYTKYTNLF